MNGWFTPAILTSLVLLIFGSGGFYYLTDNRLEEIESQKVILRPEFEAVIEAIVSRIERSDDAIEKDVAEIKTDIKSIERILLERE